MGNLLAKLCQSQENMWCNTPRRPSAAKSAATMSDNVTAEPAVPGAMHLICSSESQMVASAGQLRHVALMHESDCTIGGRGAYMAVHQQALFTRPSSKSRAPLQGSAR